MRTVANVKAFLYGIPDGWRQPHYLNTSRNVDHLFTGTDDVYEWLDRGINVGQFLRAGIKSQTWKLGYWPFGFKAADND